jgi:S1-C subfamily serine protease
MKNIKFGIFCLGLVLAIGGAISVISAHPSTQPSSAEPKIASLRAGDFAQSRRGDVFVLDGRGAQLGVRVSNVDVKAPTGGVRIEEVNEDSPAEKAGLQEGDVVVEYDGERVRSARQFTRLVQETPDGRTVKIAVLRNGQKQTVDATPETGRNAWNFEIDGDQIRREIERGLRDLPGEPFEFHFDDRGPRRFEYRLPERVMPFMGSRGRLGVSVQSLTPDLEEYFGATNGGVLVSSVARDSAAAKAGIKAGDVITSINGARVSDSGDLMHQLDAATGELTIVVLRDKKEMTLKATLTRASGVL